ncbi:MAG: glucose-6-phosphate isomerase [Acidimicrobiales bacterium]
MLLDEQLGSLAAAAGEAVRDLHRRDAARRIRDGDHTLWQDDPTEVADRLGWLSCLPEMKEQVPELLDVADECRFEGLERAVVLGMGGSSLFPEVLARAFGSRPDRLDLTVLDTTDPAAVARVGDEWPLPRTLFLAASKSGTTIETRSHLEHFWSLQPGPANFAATTDPGSALAELARQRSFRHVFENRSDIGGRYSALSLFGLVPAALAGVSCDALLDGGLWALEQLDAGLRLGAVVGAAVQSGRDKLTLVIDHRLAAFGLWIEQLVAESTGKHGTGALPVVGEPLGPPGVYGDDRLFVALGDVGEDDRLALDQLADEGHPVVGLPLEGPDAELVSALGVQVLLWEYATAVCGSVLGINPFDQPDVAAAKAATSAVLESGVVPDEPTVALDDLLRGVQPGDYVSFHAYVDPASEAVETVERARVALRDRLRVATTVGLGPRFLHSTGQFHKGGPPTGVFVQVVGDDAVDVPIPGAPYGFSTLKQAQAAGDLRTLRAGGRRAARVALDDVMKVASE